jgi:hypothetical protein
MFINTTETLGVILAQGTNYTTGSIFLSLLVFLFLLLAIALLFGIRLEYTAILVLPLLISYMAYYGEFIAVGSIFLIYLAMIFSHQFIFK